MKKIVKSIILTIFPLIAVIAIDQYSKNWALSIESPKYFWELKFNLIYNQGIVLGHLTHLPARVKEISLVTMGAFVVTFYLLAIWLLPIRSRACFLGLSILVGGIIGNVLDRFNGHGVIDFISLNLNFINFPYMNLADIFQWVGYTLIAIGLSRDSIYYWPENDLRNKYIVNLRFQIRCSLFISFLTFLSGGVTIIFSHAFLKELQTPEVIKYFYITGFFVTSIFSFVTFLISLAVTQRIAGPVYAVKRQVLHLLNGEYTPFKLRVNDEFVEIEKDINLLTERLKKINKTPNEDLIQQSTKEKSDNEAA